MKIYWLGQAGLLLEKDDVKIIVDPYLSDSCGKLNSKKHRRMEIDEKLFDIEPDFIICTHNHLDHLDPETLRRYLTPDSSVTVLCSEGGFDKLRSFGENNNYIMLHPGTEWTEKGIRFSAVDADHSETTAIGVIIDDGERKYYISGDTLYNQDIFKRLPADIFTVFLPVNGIGNNMNMTDAARFAERTRAKWVVPLHWGMFDSLDVSEFACKNKRIPTIYEEVVLP